MTAQELISKLKEFPKYLEVVYIVDYYVFNINTIINDSGSIILSCDASITNIMNVRQLASKLLKGNLNSPVKITGRCNYQIDKVGVFNNSVFITTKLNNLS